MTKQAVLSEVETWSLDDRLDLLEVLWSSVAPQTNAIRPSESQLAELRRRLSAHDEDSSGSIEEDQMNAMLASLRVTK